MKDTMFYIILALFIISGIFDAYASETGKKRYFKILLMPLLGTLYFLYANNRNTLILAALVFCWIGDIALIKKNKYTLAAGILAFACGHVCYILYLYQPIQLNHIWWLSLIGIIYICYFLFAYRKIMMKCSRKMTAALHFYLFFLMAMTFSAFSYFLGYYDQPSFLVWVGSLCFLISDTIIAFNIFVKEKRYPGDMELYIIAQLLIILNIL